MNTERRIFVAFAANLLLAIVGVVGGLLSGSFAIVSDSIHSLGDSITIGISFFLERKSHKGADRKHTFGYARYSLLGGLITNVFLLFSASVLLLESFHGLFEEPELKADSMIGLALVGALLNAVAVAATHARHDQNEKAVNLHAVQDVLSWLAIIIGSIVIQKTGFLQIDSIMSILISGYILVRAILGIRESAYVFLDNTPPSVDCGKLTKELLSVYGVVSLHHLHIWSLDGEQNCATLHLVVTNREIDEEIKASAVAIFKHYNIKHITIETELATKPCSRKACQIHH